MNIILAGYNIDYEIIQKFNSLNSNADPATPETISAAYARISRNPRAVNELRAIARKEVEKARKSNQTIVFDMGHSSIAEHTVFNIDVIGISRLIVEEIEKFRLCSYTEKSQRYIRLEDDFVIPVEIKKAGLQELFTATIKEQYRCYHNLYNQLRDYTFETHAELARDPANRSLLEGWAKEDARYIIPLATETQLGMTINARNLELMLRRLSAHHMEEVRKCGKNLYKVTKPVAPSLIRYAEATPFDIQTRENLKQQTSAINKTLPSSPALSSKVRQEGLVKLLSATPDGDDRIIAALLYTSSSLSMEQCMNAAVALDRKKKEEIIQTACMYMESYDQPLREFENAVLSFEVTISASCFAQLKRHRMLTIINQQYDPSLGVSIPPAIKAVGMENLFMNMIAQTEETYATLEKAVPRMGAYVLTNAHRKRVMLTTNVRELYHIVRLREDRHAQWDIRNTAEAMIRLGKQVMPISLLFATGKDSFYDLRKALTKR